MLHALYLPGPPERVLLETAESFLLVLEGSLQEGVQTKHERISCPFMGLVSVRLLSPSINYILHH